MMRAAASKKPTVNKPLIRPYFWGGTLVGGLFSPDSDSYRVLISNRGGGRRTTLADWTWHLFAIAVLGPIVVCYGWGGG